MGELASGEGLFNSLIVIVQIQNPESQVRYVDPEVNIPLLFGSCLHDFDLTPVSEL